MNLIPGRRVVMIVLDSVGIGAMPDADQFGDEGSDTLGNLSRSLPLGLNLPWFQRLGLGNIAPISGILPHPAPLASFGKCAEASPAKDTTTGHWELAGLISQSPLPTYPQGFPDEVISAFTKEIGIGILGNRPASGTEIIAELGEIHMRTGRLIIYTSADSVFQIAAHEDLYPPDKLYEMCLIARRILTGTHAVGRVIARPFTGEPGAFVRTFNRRDFSLSPPGKTLPDHIVEAGGTVVGIGKIGDIFNHRGITSEIHTHSNSEGITATILVLRERAHASLIFANLVDFDMLYGHRNNPAGYYQSLREFDVKIPEILDSMQEDDLLILTADHGCDPTFLKSTDHTREYVPLLVVRKGRGPGLNLGIRDTFADIARSADEFLGLGRVTEGISFISELP
ncbi:MAG TPA: phosphopentomutase [Candidatus Sumerlaeota bacterium]|mgnify:CR=1 FL=1|nr:phosphopentomutase [Candidatus Sumerlaeota bacterium]